MVSTIASMGVLVSANVAPAMNSMNQMGAKVKDVGQTAQAEGAKTAGFMKQWGSAFAAIGAAATGALYMVVKASPLLSGAMQEAQDAISLLFMTIGDALEPIIRPFVDMLWGLVDIIGDMPAPLNTLTAAFIAVGGSITAILGGLCLLPTVLHAVGLASGAAASPVLLLSTAFFGIVTVAGLVAAALYYLSGDPTLAIVGALETIGIGATILFHNPVIFAITTIANAFIMLGTASNDMGVAVGLALAGIGVAATALMGHPVFAAGVGLVALFMGFAKASDDMKIVIIAVFGAIGVAASTLLANPVIAAITAIVDAILVLAAAWERVSGMFGGELQSALREQGFRVGFPSITGGGGLLYQHGGYVPYTGPALLHAGEYVVPAGRMGGGAGGGIQNIYNTFDIHDVTLAGGMDVERLKQKLDELYKRDIGRHP